MLREPHLKNTYNNMFKSTFTSRTIHLLMENITTRALIIMLILLLITMGPLITTELRLITLIPIIITMGIFITLTMMAHTEEHITGTPTGGTLTFN
jgi:hypothetical protein